MEMERRGKSDSLLRKRDEQLQPSFHKKSRLTLSCHPANESKLPTSETPLLGLFASASSSLLLTSRGTADSTLSAAPSIQRHPHDAAHSDDTIVSDDAAKTDTEALSDDTSAGEEHLHGSLDESDNEDDSISSGSECDSLTTSKEEDRIVQELVQAVFSSRQRQPHEKAQTRLSMEAFVRWLSNPDCSLREFSALVQNSTIPGLTVNASPPPPPPRPLWVKPRDHLQTLLGKAGRECRIIPASDLTHFFEPITDVYVRGYTLDVAKAVRADNVDYLQQLQQQGRLQLPCGTSYGDSILHTACRRQCVRVVEYLLLSHKISSHLPVVDNSGDIAAATAAAPNDPKVKVATLPRQQHQRGLMTVRLANQCGRTPLTDCCWTTQPNVSWHAALALLAQCPDLLYISDRHGYTPLDYVPQKYWPDWCRFLDQLGAERLAARTIYTLTKDA